MHIGLYCFRISRTQPSAAYDAMLLMERQCRWSVKSGRQFIKLASQKEIEAQLNQNNATYKQHIVFIVNDCNSELGSGEGFHWSLLVYARDANTWYHMDSGKGINTPHAKLIMDRVNKYFISLGSLQNSRTDYIESRCTQQKNGYDWTTHDIIC